MAIDTDALQRVPEAQRESVRQYATRLMHFGGSRIHSMALYGPIARGDFDAAHDVVRSVVVMDRVDLEALRQLAAEGHRLGRAGIGAPLVLTPEFVQQSLDTYPLELIEIQSAYIVILGEDDYGGLQFDAPHVRLQCERELKVLLLAMRQVAVTHGATERELRRAAWPPLLDLLRVLRGMCWLKGQRQAMSPRELAIQAEAILGKPLGGIRRAVDDRGATDWPTIQSLYRDIETLGAAANDW